MADTPVRGVMAPVGLPSGYMFNQQPGMAVPDQALIQLPNGMVMPVGMLKPAADYLLDGTSIPQQRLDGTDGLGVYERAGAKFTKAFGLERPQFAMGEGGKRAASLGDVWDESVPAQAAREYEQASADYASERDARRAAMRKARTGREDYPEGRSWDLSPPTPSFDMGSGGQRTLSLGEALGYGNSAAEEAPSGPSPLEMSRAARSSENARIAQARGEVPVESNAMPGMVDRVRAANGMGPLDGSAVGTGENLGISAPSDLSTLRPEPAPERFDSAQAVDLLAQQQAAGVVDSNGRVVSALGDLRPSPRPVAPGGQPAAPQPRAQVRPAGQVSPAPQPAPEGDLSTIRPEPRPDGVIGEAAAQHVAAQAGQEDSFDKMMKFVLGKNADPTQEEKDKAADRALALMQAGFATMAAASKPGATALGALGSGGATGVATYKSEQKDRAAREVAGMEKRLGIAKLYSDESNRKEQRADRKSEKEMDRELRREEAKIRSEDRRYVADTAADARRDAAADRAVTREGQTLAIAKMIQAENPGMTTAEAVKAAKGMDNSKVDTQLERLAQSAFKQEQKDISVDPKQKKTLEQWREFYGLSGRAAGGNTNRSGSPGPSQGQPAPTARYNPATGKIEPVQ